MCSTERPVGLLFLMTLINTLTPRPPRTPRITGPLGISGPRHEPTVPILSKPLNIRQWLPQRNDSQSCVQRIPDDGTGVCEVSSAEHRPSPKDQSPCRTRVRVSVLYSESSIGDYAHGSLDTECVSFRALSLFVNNMRPAKLIVPHSKKFSSGTGGGRKPRAIPLIHVHLENGLK